MVTSASGPWFSQWYLVTLEALLELWKGFLMAIPKILGAFVILIIGWMFAVGIEKLVTRLLNKMGANDLFEKTSWTKAFKKADIKVDFSEFIGAVAYWILILVFLLAAVRILGFLAFAAFLTDILAFVPNVVVAALILVVAAILSDILEKVTVASIEKARVGYSQVAGLLVRWSILGFASMAILVQLGIARQLILTLFTGIVAFFVIALGLAFGLGGKEIAADILRDWRKKYK